jgi:hypothetical protein
MSVLNEQALAEEIWRYVIQQCAGGNDVIYDGEIAEVVAIIKRHCNVDKDGVGGCGKCGGEHPAEICDYPAWRV